MLIRMRSTVVNGSVVLSAGSVLDLESSLANRLIAGGSAVLASVGDVVANPGAGLVVSSAAPVDADGRPDGTIYIQTA